jgi:predicted dehydrogenase
VEKLKVAVVGLGKMGLLHASILNFLPNVEVVALCDKSAVIRRFSKKIFEPAGIKVVTDIEDLSNLNLEAAYVTTPISSHSVITKDLYESKIAHNLFVEKTLASNYEEAKALCELAHNYGGINMVGYMKRFAVTFRKAKNFLSNGELGEIYSFDAYAYSSDFLEAKVGSKKSASRGGALRDLGCHVIDLALWLLGDFQVDSVKQQTEPTEAAKELVCFNVKSSSGVKGQFTVSRAKENYRMPEMGLVINGSEGTLIVNDDKTDLRLSSGASSTWHRHDLGDSVDFWLGESEYFRENQHFIESILHGKKAEPDFHTASEVNGIIDQVRAKGGDV